MLGANDLLVDSRQLELHGRATLDQFFDVLHKLAGPVAVTLWDHQVAALAILPPGLVPQLLHDGEPEDRPALHGTVRVFFTKDGFAVDCDGRNYAVACWKQDHGCWYVVVSTKWPLADVEDLIEKANWETS